MPTRANAFYSRLTKLDYHKGHVYHTTTKARFTQAKFFLDCLTGEATVDAPEYLDEFDRRDMFLFGLVNSLRSSLDAFAHEIVLFYGGPLKKGERIQFLNLTKIKTAAPPPQALQDWVRMFQRDKAFKDLNKLRNAQQHRSYLLPQTRTATLASLTVMGSDGEAHQADWWGSGASPQMEVGVRPAAVSLPEPDLILPDNPGAEPGGETYSLDRPVLAVMRHLYQETREFILASYVLAI